MSIQGYFADKELLVTGVTGLVGKALLEKILRDLPHVRRVHLLIRERVTRNGRRVTPEERLQREILTSSAFDRLREAHGDEGLAALVREKVRVVGGDLSEDEPRHRAGDPPKPPAERQGHHQLRRYGLLRRLPQRGPGPQHTGPSSRTGLRPRLRVAAGGPGIDLLRPRHQRRGRKRGAPGPQRGPAAEHRPLRRGRRGRCRIGTDPQGGAPLARPDTQGLFRLRGAAAGGRSQLRRQAAGGRGASQGVGRA